MKANANVLFGQRHKKLRISRIAIKIKMVTVGIEPTRLLASRS